MSSPWFGPSMAQLRQEHVLSDQTVDWLSGTLCQRILTGDSSTASRQCTFSNHDWAFAQFRPAVIKANTCSSAFRRGMARVARVSLMEHLGQSK
jgi:hypothetical protein